MNPRSLLAVLPVFCPTLLLAQSPIYSLGESIVPETFTTTIQAVGDTDQDGRADFTVAGRGTGGSLSLGLTLVSGGTGTARQRVTSNPQRAMLLVDLDGDGILEYVSTTSFYSAGTVHVHAGGPNGALLFSLAPPAGSVSFGEHINLLSDLDGDGTRDLAVSAPRDPVVLGGQLIQGIGTVFCYSGRDGTPLGTFTPTTLTLRFGTAVTGISDVNGDGTDDLAIGGQGRAFVFSGRDQTLIHELGTTSVSSRFGTVIADVGDLDGDHVSEVAVGAPHGEWPALEGWVAIYSGYSGLELRRLEGEQGDLFGWSVSGGADLNRDGIPDVVVGAPQRSYYTPAIQEFGYVRAFSGLDGSEIFTATGSQPGEGFGAVVAVVGDVNGDGTADIATARLNFPVGTATTPFVKVISGRPLMLTTDCHQVSLAIGGNQQISIDAGQGHGGDTYLVLGSLSTSPGSVLHGVSVPLVVDEWLLLSLSAANTGMFSNTLGTLDNQGRAQAALLVPALQIPALAGLTLHHAALVLRDGMLRAASAAAPLTLTL